MDVLELGRKPVPSASHENWMKQKEADGWKYGAVKNAETKEHPCYVAYSELPPEQRVKDYIFCSIVEAFYRAEIESKPVSAQTVV
jgi:hypothetical protein